MLADLRTQLLDDRRTHRIRRRLSTKRVLTNLLWRNLLLGRRASTAPTTTTTAILGRRRRVIICHGERNKNLK